MLAALLYIALPFFANKGPGRGEAIMGDVFALGLLLIPMWLCLGCGLCAAVANGAMDWLGTARGTQYAIAGLSCAALLVVTWFSGAIGGEPVDQTP